MWTLNSVRIFVTKLDSTYKNIIARLHPLGGGTIHHNFGYEDDTGNLTCYIVGGTDLNALKALAQSGTSYELDSPYGDLGDFYVNSIQHELLNNICQSLRRDLNEDAPVYLAQIEIFIDV